MVVEEFVVQQVARDPVVDGEKSPTVSADVEMWPTAAVDVEMLSSAAAAGEAAALDAAAEGAGSVAAGAGLQRLQQPAAVLALPQ